MDLERSESEVNFLKFRERTKSVGDVPKHPFLLPFSSRFQVSSSFKFHVFLLLQTFLNVCYFTFLTPFRFTQSKSKKGSGQSYTIQTNPIQQVLSTLVISAATIYALLDLRYFLHQNLKEAPHKAFRYSYGLLKGFIPLFWTLTFWLRRKWFLKLLAVCQGKQKSQQQQKYQLFKKNSKTVNLTIPSLELRCIVNVLVGLTLVKVLFELWYSFEDFEVLLSHNAGTLLYNLYFMDDGGAGLDDVYDSPALIMLGILATYLSVMLNYIEYMFDLFCFIGAAMVFALCDHFTDEMEKLSRTTSPNNAGLDEQLLEPRRVLKVVQRKYVDLIAILDSINEVFGSLIVLYFLGSYPTLVWSVFGLFRKVTLSHGIFYVHKICLFVLVTATAAEGNSKVEQFKRWLFHTSVSSSKTAAFEDDYNNGGRGGFGSSRTSSNNEINKIRKEPTDPQFNCHLTVATDEDESIDMASLNILHREVSSEILGLKGYKFFTVTYDLIGTMIGIVVTYAIVMLQFEMDADENPKTGLNTVTTLSFAKDSVLNSTIVQAVDS